MMNVDKVSQASNAYSNDAKKTPAKTEATVKAAEEGAVYEGGKNNVKPATYSIHKMSTADRTALVNQMKADAEARQNQFLSMVQEMFSGQTNAYGQANNIYRFLASGKYTVDPATKLQAQKDIAEDGYYGVEQTSSRIFDFAMALAGNDVNKMKEMQEAFEKGFQKAEKIWGGKLPDISYQTKEAVKQKFDDFYASMNVE